MGIKTCLGILLGVLIAEIGAAGHSNHCQNRRENPVNPFSYYQNINGKDTLILCSPGQIFNKTSCNCNEVQVVQGGANSQFNSQQNSMKWSMSGSGGAGGMLTNLASGGMVGSGGMAGSGGMTGSGSSSGRFKVTLPFNPNLLKWTKTSDDGGWSAGADWGGSMSGGMNTQNRMSMSGSQSGKWDSRNNNWMNDLQFMGSHMRPHGQFVPNSLGPIMNVKVSGAGGNTQTASSSLSASMMMQSLINRIIGGGAGGSFIVGPSTPGYPIPQLPQGVLDANGSTKYQISRQIVRYEKGMPVYQYYIRSNQQGHLNPGAMPNMNFHPSMILNGIRPGGWGASGTHSGSGASQQGISGILQQGGSAFDLQNAWLQQGRSAPHQNAWLQQGSSIPSQNAWLQQGSAGTGSIGNTAGGAGAGGSWKWVTDASGQGKYVWVSNADLASAFYNQGSASGQGTGNGQWKWVTDASGNGKYEWVSASGQGNRQYVWVPDASNAQGGSYQWVVGGGAGANGAGASAAHLAAAHAAVSGATGGQTNGAGASAAHLAAAHAAVSGAIGGQTNGAGASAAHLAAAHAAVSGATGGQTGGLFSGMYGNLDPAMMYMAAVGAAGGSSEAWDSEEI